MMRGRELVTRHIPYREGHAVIGELLYCEFLKRSVRLADNTKGEISMAKILTEEQKKEIIEGALEEIKQAVIKEATSEVSWQAKTTTSSAVHDIVEEFINKEVKPELLVSLREKKSAIIEAAILGAENMAVMLAKAMAASLAENLGTSYKRNAILKAMFD